MKPICEQGLRPLLTNLDYEHDDGRRDTMRMMILMLLVIGLFVLIVVAVVEQFSRSKMPFLMMNDREDALDILKKLYAKAEIGREEFETIRRDIE